jgi:phosphatidylglycerol---prolipoprotein diacylglyceryl transferase
MAPRVAYALFMLLACAVFLLARRVVPQPAALKALPWRTRAALALAAFVGGSLGGKLPFVFSHLGGWLDASAWLADGKTIVTGLIGAYLAVELAKLALDVRVKTGDTFALPLALALGVGRLGCFCNGCCHGVETGLPWGVAFRVAGPEGVRWARCHPTQLYEVLFHLGMALVLAGLTVRGALPGQRLKLYLIAYGVYRFLTEFIRPEPVVGLGLTFYQWAALALVAGLASQWAAERVASGGVHPRRLRDPSGAAHISA